MKAKRALGQNFLTDQRVCRKIVSLLSLSENDFVLEIGPGRGALTSLLADEPRRTLILLEKDRELVAAHKNWPDSKILNADALAFSWEKLGAIGRWKLAGNLPYNIASPLVWEIVSRCDAYDLGVFMFQKEVAERIVSPPGSGKYGALSVWLQSWAKPNYEFAIKPGSFFPPPKVDSAVVSFRPLPSEEKPRSPRALKYLLDACFQQRRKQISGIFKRSGLASLIPYLEKFEVAETARPEELSSAKFNLFADALSALYPEKFSRRNI